MITSVPVVVSPTAVQLPEQEEDELIPAVSNDAVAPAGGRTSRKLAPKIAPELPERLTVTELVPAAMLRL
jgi:hypothetical protein